MKLKNKQSFTLIELLVVIAIIGLLSTVVLVSLQGVRARARDARRLSDMKQIQAALEAYYNDHTTYPQENSSNGNWECSEEDGADFIDDLKDQGYMPKVPVDPINISTMHYCYYQYNGVGERSGCSEDFYVLAVSDMETSNKSYVSLDSGLTRIIFQGSPGWHCPSSTGVTRDWQEEYDWVAGSYK